MNANIIYPTGCRSVTDDMSTDELIKRLKVLASKFQSLGQAENESTYAEYTQLAIHLADDHFFSHSSRDVQLLVACCVADLMRMFAPEAPYKDPALIKTIFLFLIKQLGGLRDPKHLSFKRYFYLLENLSYVKSFNMCFDLEDFSEIFCALFKLMFKIIGEEHSSKVKNFIIEVLSPLISEADFVSNELLDIILVNVVEPCKTQARYANELAKELIIKTSDTLEPYIQQFFNQVLILGKPDASMSISRKVYELIYELNKICPSVLLSVLPQLEFKLKSSDEHDRMGAVSLLARMFSEKGSDLANLNRNLWLAFLGRYHDISVSIRVKCVQHTMHFLLNHPELEKDIVDTLKLRQHDSDEQVRYEVVTAIVSTSKKKFDVVADSKELLNFVKERMLDKKPKIRKEAMSGLALIYKKHLSINNPQGFVPEPMEEAVTWIKDKILHGYYVPAIEDRLQVERLLNTCLVPYDLECKERMEKLYLLFATVDEHASKAFIEIQKNQTTVRKVVAELIYLHRQPRSDRRDRELKSLIQQTSKFLPDPIKAIEHIKRFSEQLFAEPVLLQLMETVVDPDVSCRICMDSMLHILKKLGQPVKVNVYYGLIKQLLERISSVMIDREGVRELVDYVYEALTGGSILEKLGLDSHVAGERGLQLLYVISFVFPSHFMHVDVIKKIMGFLSLDSDYVAPKALAILTFAGKQRPLGDSMPNLCTILTTACLKFITEGTPKQAKSAIKCLYVNVKKEDHELVFAEILDELKLNLSFDREERFLTAIVALGYVALLVPTKFPVQIKNFVSRKIVKDLLMKDTTPTRDENLTFESYDDLPLETRCKVAGMKMMARWLIGLKNDKISAQKTFRMLKAIISTKGDLLEEGKPSLEERAYLRLAAGSAMLKICEHTGVGDEYTAEQFYDLSSLVVDKTHFVRDKFVNKLHKGLCKDIPNKCLPLCFMGLYGLCGLEQEDKKLRNTWKQYIMYDINKRRECMKNMLLSGVGTDESANERLHQILPDYMLVYSIITLAHYSHFDSYDNVDILNEIRGALWFILEPLMTKNETYSFGFYKFLIEKMKLHKDALMPEIDSANYKLWALCDLAMNVIMCRTTTYELRDFPASPVLSSMFFKSVDDPPFNNNLCYLPAEYVSKFPKKKIRAINNDVVRHATTLKRPPQDVSSSQEITSSFDTDQNDTLQPTVKDVQVSNGDSDTKKLKQSLPSSQSDSKSQHNNGSDGDTLIVSCFEDENGFSTEKTISGDPESQKEKELFENVFPVENTSCVDSSSSSLHGPPALKRPRRNIKKKILD